MASDESECSDMDDLVSQAMNSIDKVAKRLKKKSVPESQDSEDNSDDDHDQGTVNPGSLTLQAAPSTSTTSRNNEKKKKKSGLADKEFQVEPLPPHQSWRQRRKQSRKEKANTKGKNWFGMKAPEMTEEKKNDLLVLQMRQALDSKTFYKANDRKVLPKFFQVGTWVDTPQDFHHRLPRKQRKKTIVDELLADAEFRKFNKRKYSQIMEERRRGEGPYKKQKFAKRLKKKFK